jgi:hypothetical protein
LPCLALVSGRQAASIALDADADPGVRRAAADLAEDAFRVTGVRLALMTGRPAGSDIVVVGVVDATITARYHAIGGGKWDRMMSQAHIGYTSWQTPPVQAMPGVQEVQPLTGKAIGVAVEGMESA